MMTRMRVIRNGGLVAALAAVGLVGCAPEPATTTVQPAPAGPTMVMNDAAVADFFTAVNEGEIEAARLAVNRASNARVRQFAQRMIDDHTRANDQAAALGIDTRTASTDVASDLRQNARETLSALRTYEGAAFDRQYMETQVAMHRYALQTLDDALIPSARNRQLDRLLTDTRPVIAEHLEMAENLLRSLR